MNIRQVKMFLILQNQNMKMLYTRMGTKATLNAQRKSINITVRKGPETYLNRPFPQTFKTKVAKTFFQITGQIFSKDSLSINKNIVKFSYSCMSNVSKIIK